MSQGDFNHPAVKIASVITVATVAIVLGLAIIAQEQLSHIGWIIIPLVSMGVALAAIARKTKD